jgi:hypothetical protein
MNYDMQDQLALSRMRDCEIDKHLSDDWRISGEVPREMERLGIDRVWIHRKTGRRHTVEYKHDTLAHKTGNAFVETESVEGKKKGWSYTSCAQVLVYYVVGGEYAFICRMDEVERRLKGWELFYPAKAATTVDKRTGESYRTLGVCVPLPVFRSAASKVVPVYSGDEPTLRRDRGVFLRPPSASREGAA